MAKLNGIEVGYQVFLTEGGEEFGAIRSVGQHELVVYVENAGDFKVTAEAVKRVHDGKVILDVTRVDPALREAIAHAHDREEPHA
jgi:hypothetical protein